MILLILFAFLAGVVTILSPCILPILPIILSSTIGGHESGKSRPIGVIIGFIASFTFFTLFLSSIVKLIGIPADSLRFFSIIIIAGFGFSFLIPQFQALLEKLFSKLSNLAPRGNTNPNFFSGILVGFSLGLLWTPCVGPILASVISLAITGTITFNAFLITLAYSIGTAIPMFIVMIGGQNLLRRVPWLLANSSNIQKAFGIIMILTALGIFLNFDRKFQTFILDKFPQYGAGLTKLEDNQAVRNELGGMGENEVKKEDMGKPMFDLLRPKGKKAPEIIPGGVWLNSKPLTLSDLKGKVVILDFWTYSCINCQRTFPYLKSWWGKYKDKGLVIIGVHSPEFEFEKDEENVRKAISDFGIKYPVVQDNNFETWNNYNNRYWPAKYIIDKEGFVRYSHFGEGAYDETEQVIVELLKETGEKGLSAEDISNPTYDIYSRTPETYLGYSRIDGFVSPERISPNQLTNYSSPANLPNNSVAFQGKWTVMDEYASPSKGSRLFLNFEAKEVFLVMRKTGSTARVKVLLDGKAQFLGEDAENGIVSIDSDRLYKLINLSSPGKHTLELEFLDEGAQLFAFTFG